MDEVALAHLAQRRIDQRGNVLQHRREADDLARAGNVALQAAPSSGQAPGPTMPEPMARAVGERWTRLETPRPVLANQPPGGYAGKQAEAIPSNNRRRESGDPAGRLVAVNQP